MDQQDWMPQGVKLLERNGTAAPATERPNPLRRERWVDLGDMYPGHQLLIRFNPNKRGVAKLPDDMTDEQRVLWAFKRMVLAHRIHFDDGTPDGPWIDPETDLPLPSPQLDEFYELISNDVLKAIMANLEVDQKKVTESIARSSGLSTETSPANVLPSPTGTSEG